MRRCINNLMDMDKVNILLFSPLSFYSILGADNVQVLPVSLQACLRHQDTMFL